MYFLMCTLKNKLNKQQENTHQQHNKPHQQQTIKTIFHIIMLNKQSFFYQILTVSSR